MSDNSTTLSEIRLFIENMKRDMPEVFARPGQPALPFPKKTLYMGELYEVKCVQSPEAHSQVALEPGVIKITVSDPKRVFPRTVLESWFRARAEETITQRVQHWAGQMMVQYNKLAVRDQKSLWGSCSDKGNINFSWRIIKAPSAVIDYLLIHELAHILHMNHTPEFWGVVAVWSPEYKAHRKWLHSHKHELFADPEVAVEAG